MLTPAPLLHGLPPIRGPRPRVLLLGSMPGAASLNAGTYYAHPRNAFWPILAPWLGVPPDAPIGERYEALCGAGLALWDVVGACERRTSLDSDIVPRSVVSNDIAGLLNECPDIAWLFFNGTAAHKLYVRHVERVAPVRVLAGWRVLPSTSPAFAAVSPATKASVWHEALATAGVLRPPDRR